MKARAATSVSLLMMLTVALACARPGRGTSAEPAMATTAAATSAASTTLLPTQTASPSATTPAPNDGSGIELTGPTEFVEQAQAALDLLASCAPEALARADEQLQAIVHSDRSGMDVDTGAFMASDTTAFAPGYPRSAQVFWFAGSIVHDAHHRWQAENGMTTNWDAMSLAERQQLEYEARAVQIEALEQCRAQIPEQDRTQTQAMIDYLTGMQTGAIPCDYCETEWADRDW